MKFDTDILSQFDKKWALLSAGGKDGHNTMTVSWGSMGTLWSKPVVTVYVKPVRHTWNFLKDNDYFTVSFYPEEYRGALELMGSKSGKDIDKDAAAGLTVRDLGEAVTYEEAEVTILCRKIYQHSMDTEPMPADVVRMFYTTEAPHWMFIGEIVDIIR